MPRTLLLANNTPDLPQRASFPQRKNTPIKNKSFLLPLRHHISGSAFASKAMSITIPPALEGLEPANLWSLFAQLSTIPRPSKQEERSETAIIHR